MDLTQNLQTIRSAIKGPYENEDSSDGSQSEITIKVCEDFGCAQNCEDDQCPVCLEKECNTMLLPCSHRFHGDCIIQWVDHSFSCPMCRSEVTHFLPLTNMDQNTQEEFIRIWDKHYVTNQPPAPQRVNHGKFSTSEKMQAASVKNTIVRTHSYASLGLATNKCHTCSGPFANANIFIAFDHKFCTNQCRLSYAKKNEKDCDEENGTTSFYVDYTQASKYIV